MEYDTRLKVVTVVTLDDVVKFCIGQKVGESGQVFEKVCAVCGLEEHPELLGGKCGQDGRAARRAVREQRSRRKKLKKMLNVFISENQLYVNTMLQYFRDTNVSFEIAKRK